MLTTFFNRNDTMTLSRICRHRSKHSSSGSSSIAVIPQDNESTMENIQFDADSGSSISLSSGGSQQDIYQHKPFMNDIHENTNGLESLLFLAMHVFASPPQPSNKTLILLLFLFQKYFEFDN